MPGRQPAGDGSAGKRHKARASSAHRASSVPPAVKKKDEADKEKRLAVPLSRRCRAQGTLHGAAVSVPERGRAPVPPQQVRLPGSGQPRGARAQGGDGAAILPRPLKPLLTRLGSGARQDGPGDGEQQQQEQQQRDRKSVV